MTEALMKEGMWVLRFFTLKERTMVWYFGGIYETAQQAYFAGLKYVSDEQEMFEENGNDAPENMVIELCDMGKYPENVEYQYIFPFFPDQLGAYADCHGVTRPSFMTERHQLLVDAGLIVDGP